MNEQKKTTKMLWQNGKVTTHKLTETQKKAFRELYKTLEYVELKQEEANNEIQNNKKSR